MRPGSPVVGFLVNATPVPDRSPRLPNTIAWTVAAVPSDSSIPSTARYRTARGAVHDSNTTLTDCSIWCMGSAGTSNPSARSAAATAAGSGPVDAFASTSRGAPSTISA